MPEENIRKAAGEVLSSNCRTEVVKRLADKDLGFEQLRRELNATSGNLAYHLMRLRSVGLLTRRQSRYCLTDAGKMIVEKFLM